MNPWAVSYTQAILLNIVDFVESKLFIDQVG
jgi:hypothetical protein